MTQHGNVTKQEGYVQDPFSEFERQAGGRGAKLSMSVSRGGNDYGQTKCSCNITIVCPQDTQSLDRAAELCFDTALRYVNWGMRYMAPELPPVPGPSAYAGHRNT